MNLSVSIESKEGYLVKLYKDRTYGILFEGTTPLFKGKIMSFKDFKEEYKDNECMVLFEVFKTKKGNKYICM